MDACAVSLAGAASGYADNLRAIFRLSFHFGFFQFLMPLIGWGLGIGFISYMESFDHWIAFGLLVFVGVRMIISGTDPCEENQKNDPSKGINLVMLSIATSIDALAIGLGFAFLKVNIWQASIIIGAITSFLCIVAIKIGRSLGAFFGRRMETIGGLILIAIGCKILVGHIL